MATRVLPTAAQIMEAASGDIDAVITAVGGADQVWFNPGDGRYYVAARDMPGVPSSGSSMH